MWTHYNRLLLRGVRSEPPGPSGGGYHFRKKLKVLLSARFYRPIPIIQSADKLIPISRVVGGQHVVDEFRHR